MNSAICVLLLHSFEPLLKLFIMIIHIITKTCEIYLFGAINNYEDGSIRKDNERLHVELGIVL